MGISVLLLLWNILRSLRVGKIAGDNPWDAWTLEWATTSPPPPQNFDEIPEINGRRPLWDLKHPDRVDEPNADRSKHIVHNPEKNFTGIIWFIGSEIAFFLMLMVTYFLFNYKLPPGPNALNQLDLIPTFIFTACLLASSFTIWRSEVAHKREQFGRMSWWLGATILLGLIFILGQGHEYYGLYEKGTVLNSNLFATTFFTLTGFHGLHVCFGLVALLIVLFLSLKGDVKKCKLPALEIVGVYWHFVDAVWIFVLLIVYIYPHTELVHLLTNH